MHKEWKVRGVRRTLNSPPVTPLCICPPWYLVLKVIERNRHLIHLYVGIESSLLAKVPIRFSPLPLGGFRGRGEKRIGTLASEYGIDCRTYCSCIFRKEYGLTLSYLLYFLWNVWNCWSCRGGTNRYLVSQWISLKEGRKNSGWPVIRSNKSVVPHFGNPATKK